MSEQHIVSTKPIIIAPSMFTDPDEASGLLSSSYAPVVLEPLASRRLDITVSGVMLPEMQIYRTDTGSGLNFSSVGYFNGFTLSWMNKGAGRVRCGGRQFEFGGDDALITDATKVDQLELTDGSNFRGLAVDAIPIQRALCQRLGLEAAKRLHFETRQMSIAVRKSCEGIADILYRGIARDGHLIENPLAVQTLQDSLFNLILFGTDNNYSDALRKGAVEMPRMVRHAIDFMNTHAHLPISTTDVALSLGISLRSLQLTFQQHLETSPNRYLRSIRLRRAREEIRLSGDQKVADIARRWGFLSSGQFARLYFQEFAELPTDTVRRW